MLALTAVLVVGQLVLLVAFVLGVVAFFGLIAYDAVASRGTTPRKDEQPAYAPTPNIA